ncbi:hypothetical protein EXIGLDRAFT_721627 [Exidia glandulosa HHB12029]|uniref:Polysaccharide lyase 14 domain-containing protein n=1 Tax=Exidia glandulosa HHB12029 TaxID=1314781 RepID=A0A165FKH9_EXIGL|nr:hypothetical protein EXIGLDRAFT_721627 [Exidia glandulosa HHB12029]
MLQVQQVLLSLAVFLATAHAFNASHVFPVPVKAGSAWTTLPTAPAGNGASAQVVPLTDKALGVIKVSANLTHNVVLAPDIGTAPTGTQAWQALYPAGSYNPSATDAPRGGIGMYFPGPTGAALNWSDPSVTQIVFSYAVFFPAGFQFVKGGKLPGPYGGATNDTAFACSGGRQEDRAGCFDLRLMWRTDGAGEVYAYLPELDSNSAAVTKLKGSILDSSFGASVARGAFKFATGDWTVVAQRVQLNNVTAANPDGEIELFVNGVSVIHATGLTIRSQAESVFRGVHFQTFFGGSDNTWASPVDQTTYFAAISGAVLNPGASPNEGKAAFPLA